LGGVEWLKFQRFLIDADKNEIRTSRSIASLASQQILNLLVTTPDIRQIWDSRQETRRYYDQSDESADASQDQQAMPMKPMHGGIISENVEAA